MLEWGLSLMTGKFHCNISLLEKEWPTVVSIVNCRSFLWFKDSCSLLTRKAQAWLSGSWCVCGADEWGASWFSLQTFTSSLCFHGAYLPCPLPGGVSPSPEPLSCNPCCWSWGDTAIRAYRVGKGQGRAWPRHKLAFLLSLQIASSTNFRAFLRFGGLVWLLVGRVSPLWSLTF